MADRMLGALGLDDAELSVLLTDDARIRELNRDHRHKDRPTDVLAFPLDESDDGHGPRLLGDVVISLDTAARQARGRRRELAAEVRFLLAHGLLHLIGYDHATPPEKRAMSALTRRLVARSLARGTEKSPLLTPTRTRKPAGRPRLARVPRRSPGKHA
jgi:probable rRNA maturation factor